ncbi:MAG: hypothetical protein ILO68_05760 [Clostridia bacterium]|nr:hypothetical protein [Clostridia bacterium]
MKLLAGVKGTGKTKALVEEVNRVCEQSNGEVVFVEKGKGLTFDVNYRVRLVDIDEYGVSGGKALYGFICGILSANYDITELFIDGAYKLCNGSVEELEDFLLRISRITDRNNIDCTVTASIDPEQLSEPVRRFLAE